MSVLSKIARVCWMDRRRHLRAMLAIERDSFDEPWGLEDFLMFDAEQDGVSLVAVDDRNEMQQTLLGYVLYRLRPHSFVVANLAVSPSCRRQGVGTLLIDRIKDKLRPCKRTRIVADVADFNLDAQLFFRENGFRATKILHGWFDRGVDAYEMIHELEED